jgi:hypothetical protein
VTVDDPGAGGVRQRVSSDLVQLHDDLWVAHRPLDILGVQLGARMTVVRFGDALLLHSPVAPDDALRHALADLGRVRWVVGPNRFHHLYLGPWMALGAEGWAVPFLHRKRADLAFTGTVGRGSPWPDALEPYALSSIPFTDEAVFLHRPSRTLVVSDLLFNFPAEAPWFTRAAMWAGGAYPGACCSLLERVMMKRAAARTDLARILRWDFDRVVLAHGAVVEAGGHEALARAYSWLEAT